MIFDAFFSFLLHSIAMFRIRLAKREDYPQVMELLHLVRMDMEIRNLSIWDDEYPSSSLIEEDILEQRAKVAVIDKKVIGYFVEEDQETGFGEVVFKKNVLAFSRFMVHPHFQREGIGKKMIEVIQEDALSKQMEGIGILVHPINKPALRFYEKNGFVCQGRKEFPYGSFDCYLFLFSSK